MYSQVVRSRKEQTIEGAGRTASMAQWLELTTSILGSQIRTRTHAFILPPLSITSLAQISQIIDVQGYESMQINQSIARIA